MKEENQLFDQLIDKSKKYINTSFELFKLTALDKSSDILAVLVYRLIIFVAVTIFTVMANIGIAIWLGEVLGQTSYGFFIVAGFYLIFALFIYKFREKLVKRPISEMIVSQILKEEEE
jgi:membrane protein implicated in regulation of membrane protease activity